MSLAGIAISIGVLVDSSIVMAENVMHRLRERFGNRPVEGDVNDVVLPACLAVGRPIVFSVAIMLLSFLPVFALGGIEGKMFHPLAFTKSFALMAVAVLAITAVPALCSLLIRGRLRSEAENPLVRGVIEVYRPVLSYLMENPAALAWILSVTFLVGFAPLAIRPLFLTTLFLGLTATTLLARRRSTRILAPVEPLARGPRRRPDDETLAAQVPGAPGRGNGDGHADHCAPGFRDRIARRPESARYGPLPISRSRHGRRQGRAGRNPDRPCSPGHDRDHGEFSPPRALAAAQARVP